MAATSTNKQPLLVDRVLHYVVDLEDSVNNGLDVKGGNTATLLVDSTTADGAIIEDVYTIARPQSGGNSFAVEYNVNLYISTARDYLRPQEARYIGGFSSATTAKLVTRWEEMPRILAPVPHVGEQYNTALYIPKGYAMWAAVDTSLASTSGAPILGVQGGWY
jgi:hypothetical protein